MVERNIANISKQEYVYVRIEYGKIIKEYIFIKGDDAIYGVWNVYNSKKVPNKKVVNLQRESLPKMK